MSFNFDSTMDYTEVSVAFGLFKIYNRALSETEIKALYLARVKGLSLNLPHLRPVAEGVFAVTRRGNATRIRVLMCKYK